jgi:hypothetical protein
MNGFVFDAKAARGAIAIRGHKTTAAAVPAVPAVLAAKGRAVARKPQEPQGKPFQTAIAQPQEPQEPQGVSFPASTVSADKNEERKAAAMSSVPDSYLDAWAQFQSQCPGGVSEERWRQAIDDAGRFLNQWGNLADSFGWSPNDLFDAPRDDVTGLAWWIKGRTVSTLGPEHAGVGQPAYDRVTRREWVNPYTRQVRPLSISPILEHQQKIMQRVLGR